MHTSSLCYCCPFGRPVVGGLGRTLQTSRVVCRCDEGQGRMQEAR